MDAAAAPTAPGGARLAAAGDVPPVDVAELACQLLAAHRRAYSSRAGHQAHRPRVIKRPFEVLEMAFQVASQIMVALLAPKVNPVVPWLSRLVLRRDYPETLVAPSMAVLVSGLHAKLALDAANMWGFPPFRWVEPRPPAYEQLHALSLYGLEFNLLGSLCGVGLGRLVVGVRQGLRCVIEGYAGQLPPGFRVVAAVGLHLGAATLLAPIVVSGLSSALRDAQLQGRRLVPCALGRLRRRASRLAARRGGGGAADAGTALWWDGVEESEVPPELFCPITGCVFVRPAVLHGMAFEMAAVRRWVETTGRHPILQGHWCHVCEIAPAPDIQALCQRLASQNGWVLRA